MERRPELLSSVMLRQNPHNVHEWHKRVKLFAGQPHKQILTFTEAVTTVDIDKAVGKVHTLWTAFARFYERHGDLDNARVIFDKATQVCPEGAACPHRMHQGVEKPRAQGSGMHDACPRHACMHALVECIRCMQQEIKADHRHRQQPRHISAR